MHSRVSVAPHNSRSQLTAADFLEWLKSGRDADLIDGEVFKHSPVSVRHGNLLQFVELMLRSYIERHELGRLYRGAVAVRLSSRNVFLPDLSFYAAGRDDARGDTYLDGVPDLVVEVLSPRTADYDAGPKFAKYQEHGVRECWLLDPDTLVHRCFRRRTATGAESGFAAKRELAEYDHDTSVISSTVVPGFFLRRSWLDPGNMPRVDEAVRDLKHA